MPNCPLCLGRKYLAYDVPLGDPKLGEIYPCPRCKGTGIVASVPPSPPKQVPLGGSIQEGPRPCSECGEMVYPPVTICSICQAKADKDWAEVV